LRVTARRLKPGAGANDIGTIGFNEGLTDGVVALDDYNAPPIGFNPMDPNSANNNVDQIAPGIERVNISPGEIARRPGTTWMSV
jgi:hypothetical protein